ncbi:MAG: hypothetical protein JWR19_829 [Pedosphaera sp.]|nr:hypothetical protein [Pedosphaera sp.]
MAINHDFVNNGQQCLHALRLPARVSGREAAVLLGFSEHDLPILVRAHLLKPLGQPGPNSPKHYASIELLQHAQDVKWLHRATEIVAKNWQKRNARRRQEQALLPGQ